MAVVREGRTVQAGSEGEGGARTPAVSTTKQQQQQLGYSARCRGGSRQMKPQFFPDHQATPDRLPHCCKRACRNPHSRHQLRPQAAQAILQLQRRTLMMAAPRCCTTWMNSPSRYSSLPITCGQTDWYRMAAVSAAHARGSSFQQCTFVQRFQQGIPEVWTSDGKTAAPGSGSCSGGGGSCD